MKVRPMLGEFELSGLEYLESSERRALVEHAVPGLEGSYFQDLGSVPNTIVIGGSKQGDDPRDEFLEEIRKLFNAGEPTTFVADINTGTDLTQVVIEDLDVVEVGGSTDGFRYRIVLRKYVEPPEPVAPGLLDADILADALSLTDAFDLIDQLGSVPDLGDPTPPVRDALGQVETATGGLDGVVTDLENLFNEEAAAATAADEEAGGGAEGGAPGVAGALPSSEEVERALSDSNVDPGTRGTLRDMLSSPEAAGAAASLVHGLSGGTLAGIQGDDSEAAAALAQAHGVEPASLIPAGEDAALVLDPVEPLAAAPTIVVRSAARETPGRLANALERVSATFQLFEMGSVGLCTSSAAAVPVANLVPSTFCQLGGGTPVAAPQVTVKFLALERYAFDQSSVQSRHLPALHRVAHLVIDSQVAEPIRTIRLIGHTDSVGDESYNDSLGRQRAANVRTALIALLDQLRPGVSATVDIQVETRGEDEPLASNDTEDGRTRNRRVEVLLTRTCQAFFAQYDLRFLPEDPVFGIPAHPSMTEEDKEIRTEDVNSVVDELLPRRDRRASAALTGIVPAPVEAPRSLQPAVRRLSDAQLELYREYFPDESGGIDFAAFQACYEQFANGELQNPNPAPGEPEGVGEPNGGFYFLFAEFAFLCIDSGIDAALWTSALRAFVKTQEIFMHVYRPAPHPAPPAVNAPVPSRGAALRSLDDFDNANFDAAGQSNAARKAELRTKYAPLNITKLREAARDNMLRAQRMPPPETPPAPAKGIEEGRGDAEENDAIPVRELVANPLVFDRNPQLAVMGFAVRSSVKPVAAPAPPARHTGSPPSQDAQLAPLIRRVIAGEFGGRGKNEFDVARGAFVDPELDRVFQAYADFWLDAKGNPIDTRESTASALDKVPATAHVGGHSAGKVVRDIPVWVNIFQNHLINTPRLDFTTRLPDDHRATQRLLQAFFNFDTARRNGTVHPSLEEFFFHVGKTEENGQSRVLGGPGADWCAAASHIAAVRGLLRGGLRFKPGPFVPADTDKSYADVRGQQLTRLEKWSERPASATETVNRSGVDPGNPLPLQPGDIITVINGGPTGPLSGHVATVVREIPAPSPDVTEDPARPRPISEIIYVSGNAAGSRLFDGSVRVERVIREDLPTGYRFLPVATLTNRYAAQKQKVVKLQEEVQALLRKLDETLAQSPELAEELLAAFAVTAGPLITESTNAEFEKERIEKEAADRGLPVDREDALKNFPGKFAPLEAGVSWVAVIIHASKLGERDAAGRSTDPDIVVGKKLEEIPGDHPPFE